MPSSSTILSRNKPNLCWKTQRHIYRNAVHLIFVQIPGVIKTQPLLSLIYESGEAVAQLPREVVDASPWKRSRAGWMEL